MLYKLEQTNARATDSIRLRKLKTINEQPKILSDKSALHNAGNVTTCYACLMHITLLQ